MSTGKGAAIPGLLIQMHHIGCAVESIERALTYYRGALGFHRISASVEIQNQRVRVCFVETAPGVYVELIEPIGDESPVRSFLRKQEHYYHICYCVADVAQAIRDLEAQGFRLVSSFQAEAFSNELCAFLSTPEGILIELCKDGSFTLL